MQTITMRHPCPLDNTLNRFGDFDELVYVISRKECGAKHHYRYWLTSKTKAPLRLTRREFQVYTELLFCKAATRLEAETP